jgi:hypothetical protein
MFAAIRRYEMTRPLEDDLVAAARDRFIPRLQELEGFVDYYFIRGDDGTLATVTVFESREHAARSSEVAAQFIEEEGWSDVLPATPQITIGEVVAHARQRAMA